MSDITAYRDSTSQHNSGEHGGNLCLEVPAMFETLFSYPAILKRHREGPLATERAAYLEGLAA
jgi:hypothetical protein